MGVWINRLKTCNKGEFPSAYSLNIIDYYEEVFQGNPIQLQDEEFFQLLKPKLQDIVLDHCYRMFYRHFESFFEDTSKPFRRCITKNCRFR